MRTPGGYLLLFVKGLMMGAADVVPGVSGGTIAFISGIYVELLDSIKAVNFRALMLLFRAGPAAFWRSINGNFLATLLAGILCSIFSLARLVNYALEHRPLLIWSLFFGLILASIIYVSRQLSAWRWRQWLALLTGTAMAVTLALSPPLQLGASPPMVFFSGALAICAMILPGISGSFILLLIGMYAVLIGAVAQLDFVLLGIFAAGAGIGLLAFSRLLSWLLHHQRDNTLALLTGFLAGSLLIVWPWKRPVLTALDSHGNTLVITRELLLPADYAILVGDPRLPVCMLLMVLGLAVVLGLEYLGGRRDPF